MKQARRWVLTRPCSIAGCPNTLRYYTEKPRDVLINAEVTDKVRKISSKRPTYGTRHMATQVAREMNIPTNRKKIQRIYGKIGWNSVSKRHKRDNSCIKTQKVQTWCSQPALGGRHDIIHCGIDWRCYCFNVIDVYQGMDIIYL